MTEPVNTDGGYTRAYRRLWDHPMFRSKQEAAVFAWMISAANWRTNRVFTALGAVDLGVGELLIAERALAADFGMHRNTIRTLMHRMVEEGAITVFRDRCPHRAGTVVLINKYKDYQVVTNDLSLVQDQKKTENGTEGQPKANQYGTNTKEGNKGKKEDSVAKATDSLPPSDLFGIASPPTPLDLKAQVWATGLAFLVASGAVAESKARSVIGKWRRDFPDIEIINALAAAQAEAASEPVSFVEACLSRSKKNGTANRAGSTAGVAARNPFDTRRPVGAAGLVGELEPFHAGRIIDHEP